MLGPMGKANTAEHQIPRGASERRKKSEKKRRTKTGRECKCINSCIYIYNRFSQRIHGNA